MTVTLRADGRELLIETDPRDRRIGRYLEESGWYEAGMLEHMQGPGHAREP